MAVNLALDLLLGLAEQGGEDGFYDMFYCTVYVIVPLALAHPFLFNYRIPSPNLIIP